MSLPKHYEPRRQKALQHILASPARLPIHHGAWLESCHPLPPIPPFHRYKATRHSTPPCRIDSKVNYEIMRALSTRSAIWNDEWPHDTILCHNFLQPTSPITFITGLPTVQAQNIYHTCIFTSITCFISIFHVMKSVFYLFLFPSQSLLGIRVWRSLGNNIPTMIDVLGCALLLYLCYLWSLQLGFWCLLITNGFMLAWTSKEISTKWPKDAFMFHVLYLFFFIYTGLYPTLKFHVY